MEIIPIKTRLITPGEPLADVLVGFMSDKLKEKDILVVSSKVVSYSENRFAEESDFDEAVAAEADEFFEGVPVHLTKKFGVWVANSGIDRSNAPQGTIILWPKDPQQSCDKLRDELMQRIGIRELGVMLIDSVCHPGRRGTDGGCIVYSGFDGVSDQRGVKDLYGRELQITQVAKADGIASAANLVMGEADERTPFAVVRNAPVEFIEEKVDSVSEMSIDSKECIFSPVIDA